MAHVKKTKQANPGLQFKEVLQLAGKTYNKQQAGGSGKTPMGHNDALTHSESVNGGEPTNVEGGKEPIASQALEHSEHVGNELTSTTTTGGGRRRRKSTKKAKKTKGKKKGGKKKMTKKKEKKSRRSRRRH